MLLFPKIISEIENSDVLFHCISASHSYRMAESAVLRINFFIMGENHFIIPEDNRKRGTPMTTCNSRHYNATPDGNQ